MDQSSGSGAGPGGTANDTVHYPKVVLVTGACRFLGGYLTARLAQNPLINGVIAVDAIAPSKDMLRRMDEPSSSAPTFETPSLPR